MSFLFNSDFSFVVPEIYLFFSINVLLIIGVVLEKTVIDKTGKFSYSFLNVLAVVFLFLSVLYLNLVEVNFVAFNYIFFSNNLTLFFKVFITILTTLIILISSSYLIDEKLYTFEYGVLIALSVLGMLLLVSSYDFLIMYLALELQSLCLYILAAYKRHSFESTEASLKYFILGAFSSGIMLFGLTLLYGLVGTTSFEDFSLYAGYYAESGGVVTQHDNLIGIIFVLAGFLFKLSAAPFHFWTPDVYEGAPLIVVTFFASVTKVAALGIMVLLVYRVFLFDFEITTIILSICAFISLVIGTFGALYQSKIKRLYAYSTITHVGFILLSLGTISIEGLEASLFYIIVYVLLNLGLFSVLLGIRKVSDERKLVHLNEFFSLIHNNILLAFIFALSLFSIAGIPPLLGFYSKYYVILAAFKAGYYFLAIAAIFLSVISAVYYVRLIVLMFFEQLKSKPLLFKKVPFRLAILLSYLTLFNVIFFVVPDNMFLMCHNVAVYFFII